jgi:hypothetical protein
MEGAMYRFIKGIFTPAKIEKKGGIIQVIDSLKIGKLESLKV